MSELGTLLLISRTSISCFVFFKERLDRLYVLNNWYLFFHISEGCKSKIKVSRDLVSFETSSWLVFDPCVVRFPYNLFSVCVPVAGVSLCAHNLSCHKDINNMRARSAVMTLFLFSHLMRGSISQDS